MIIRRHIIYFSVCLRIVNCEKVTTLVEKVHDNYIRMYSVDECVACNLQLACCKRPTFFVEILNDVYIYIYVYIVQVVERTPSQQFGSGKSGLGKKNHIYI